MIAYKADLHIHTVISPCGDLEMSPCNIVAKAKEKGLSIIGIADHNCTKHGPLISSLAAKEDIYVLMGAEVTTKEEAHCLCFFPNGEVLSIFQSFLDEKLPPLPLDTKHFGFQVVVNEQEEIVEELPYLLITAIDASIEQVEQKVHELDGLFIPAHINKNKFSVISQLGFIPFDLNYDALEISPHTTKTKFCLTLPLLEQKTFIQCSDAHLIDGIGCAYTNFYIENKSFDEIKMALHNQQGRYVEIP